MVFENSPFVLFPPTSRNQPRVGQRVGVTEMLFTDSHVQERETTEKMTEATTARVCGLEYDGVAFACQQLEKKVGFPMKHKPYRSLDEIMSEYRRRHPDLDWETRDEDWFRVEQARVTLAQTFVQTLVTRTFFWSIFLRRFCFFVTLQDRRLVRAYLSKGVEGIDRLVASILPHHILCSNQHMETAYFCPESRNGVGEPGARG